MKKSILKGLVPIFAFLFAGALVSVSCNKNPQGEKVVTADISGVVVDDHNFPIEGATVTFMTADAKKEQKAVVTTDTDGKYKAVAVPSTGRLVNFTKEGYASSSVTIPEAKFASGAIELEKAVLIYSMAAIEGKVTNIAGEPYVGVTCECNGKTTTTDNEGTYRFEGLTVQDYTINFTDSEGNMASVSIVASDFVEFTAYPKTVVLSNFIIPGITYSEITAAPWWYGNNYAGGTGAFKMQWNHVGFLTAYPYKAVGYRNAAEGISLVSGPDNPGELVSYLYGRKKITAGNCYVNLCARCFRAYQNNPTQIGVGVIDLTSGKKIVNYLPGQDIYQGLKKMKGGTSFLDVEHNLFVYDLSAYIGKDIAFAIGVFGGYKRSNEEEGFPESPIVRILFSDKDMTSEFESNDLNATFSGDKPEGCSNWEGFTKANISSLTPNTGTSFTGVAGDATDGDYTAWFGTNHLMTSWSTEIKNEATTPLQDNTIFAIAAYNNDITRPTAYIMSRFTNPKKNLTLKVRTYGASPTYFRVSVVDLSNMSVTALPYTNTDAAEVGLSEGESGTIGLKHDQGTVNEPDKFATVKFDLSAYAQKDVVIVIGNHKGNNLSIYSVDLTD